MDRKRGAEVFTRMKGGEALSRLRRWLAGRTQRTHFAILVPLEWHTSNYLIRSRFKKILSDPTISAKFDADYVKALTARRAEKFALHTRLLLFNLTLTAFMGAWLLVDGLSFSLLGLSAIRTDQLVEIVRVVAAASGAYSVMISLELRQSKIILDEISNLSVGGEAAPYFRMAHATGVGEGTTELAPQPTVHAFPARFFKWIVTLWVIVFFAGLALFVAGLLAVNLAVLWSMIREPAIGPFVSRALAAMALIFDVSGFGQAVLMYIPFPFRNFTDVNETQPILEKEGRAVWWAEMQKRLAAREAKRKPKAPPPKA